MDSFLGVPVTSKGSVYGNLYLTDKLEPGGFTEEDEAMVSALALAAGIAIENARLHGRVRELALLEDRERIARDLHDTVIQRLFAVGLSLQGTTRLVEGSAAERVSQAVEDIDATIRQIRTSIFDLESIAHHDGVRRQILDLVHELDPVINADIRVTFDGPVDSVVPPVVAEHLLATAREALLNVGKHAGAHRVTVAVSAGSDLCLEVIDDGRGLPPEPDRSTGLGLKNMHSRATMLRGSFEVGSPVGDGTVLTWRVPL
jgi:signal transduction histidine kinase